ncbi:hypothetical protein DASC09_018350 [Saccharomycopsis crataegensis]|uniref:MHD domain-containing protein n=1 Tax=Saccharomycopsis crataegensis TaxID=43959 RepID=A0AAV5QHU4_9ASCO|nr:hypothetical protein DASC09_018350 [Saccharomycopsis crataegensis]
MVTAITIISHELNPLITRFYKHNDFEDAPMSEILDNFRDVLLNNNINSLPPVIRIQSYNYLYVYSNNIILMMVVADRFYDTSNIMCYLVFLKKFEEILKNYFKATALDQDMIIDNFLLLYELFDEMIDFGFVQITDFNILNEYIKMKLNVSEPEQKTKDNKELEHEMNSSISRMSTTQLSWRPKGIFYKKNEVFIDIIEKINLLMDPNGAIKKQVISGEVKVKCFLSGMPTLKLGLNEFLVHDRDSASTIDSFKRIQFDNLNFHQCVELSQFSNDNTISFIPPDGKFSLLNYKLQVHKSPLLKVMNIDFKKRIIYRKSRKPCVSQSPNPLARASTTFQASPMTSRRPSIAQSIKSGESGHSWKPDTISINETDDITKETKLLVSVELETKFTKRLSASDVSIVIPINFKKFHVNFNQVPRFKTKIGGVVLDLEKQCIVWKISSIGGSRDFQMSSEITLLNDEDIRQKYVESELLGSGSDDYDSSDSENEKTYNYYYGDKSKGNQISDKAKKIKKIYKTIQKEQKAISQTTNSHRLSRNEGPTSPNLLMETDKNLDNLATIIDSPNLPEKPHDINDNFYINKNMVKVNFKINNLTHSGLKVTYLKLNEPLLNYTSFPWVKYVCTNDEEYGFKFDFNRKGPSETIVKHFKQRIPGDQPSKFIGVAGGASQRKSWKKI